MKISTKSQSLLQIDLAAIMHNYRYLSSLAPKSVVGAAIKADAYGLGASNVAPYLYQYDGVRHFFTANVHEAWDIAPLIGMDAKIYSLGGVDIHNMDAYMHGRIVPVVNSLYEIEQLKQYLKNKQQILEIVLHLDTGMNRLGFPLNEWQILLQEDTWLEYLKPSFVMSHYVSAEEQDNPHNLWQQQKFYEHIAPLQQKIPLQTSLANTAAMALEAQYHGDLCRPGIGLYGAGLEGLKTVVRLYSPILQLKNIKKDATVGYNQTWKAQKDTIVATIALGYADGFLRSGSNGAFVGVDGFKLPVIGRVSMDLITIDVTDLPMEYQQIGQMVEIFGDHIYIDDLAKQQGTIAYELLTSLSKRYHREYQKQAK